MPELEPTPRIRITVNGKEREIPAGWTVASLVQDLGLDRSRVAVERNRDVVPKTAYDEVVLAAGDRLEVVTFVGGG